jgi:hypothetical protein
VRCPRSVVSLAVCLACADARVPSGRVLETADFLPMISDSSSPPSTESAADSLDARYEEQPRLLLRCEGGHVGAYLIVGTPLEVEAAGVDARAVAVTLDSAPSC